jgi:hypothetical protein
MGAVFLWTLPNIAELQPHIVRSVTAFELVEIGASNGVLPNHMALWVLDTLTSPAVPFG